MQLREYQSDMLLSVLSAWANGTRRPVVIAPTGSGKTACFSILTVLQEGRGRRPLILVARDELVRQTVATLNRVKRPHQRIGIIQGKVDESASSHIVVASVQTLSRVSRLARFDPKRFDLLILDECHWADSPSWRRIMEHFGAIGENEDPHTRTVGFTATLARTGKHKLGELFDEVVWERDTRWCIDQGYLVPVTAMTITLPDLDMDGIRVSRGDFQDADLGKAMADAKAGPIIAEAYREYCRGDDGNLRRAILFAPTVETAVLFMGDLRTAGVRAELVIGTTPTEERQRHYEATRRGENDVLCSVAVLTTGFDLPSVEVVLFCRPTKAAHLYIQCVGRALRLSPDTKKSSALILDCVGSSRLGLASIADLRIHDDPESRESSITSVLGAFPVVKPDLEVPEDAKFVEIDPFSGARKVSKAKTVERFKKHYLWTRKGTPFLPSSSTFESRIALHHEEDGTWRVCEVPNRGATICHERGLSLADAMCAAMHRWPVSKTNMEQPATDSQIMAMSRMHWDFDAMTATRRDVEICFASRRMDK